MLAGLASNIQTHGTVAYGLNTRSILNAQINKNKIVHWQLQQILHRILYCLHQAAPLFKYGRVTS